MTTTTAVPGHGLVAFEEPFLEDGASSVCECGWHSLLVADAAAARDAHQNHTASVKEGNQQ
jgi:hypothetical protein